MKPCVNPTSLLAAATVCLVTAGCVSSDTTRLPRGSNSAEDACIAAVSRNTPGQIGNVTANSSQLSGVGTLVQITANAERWRCIVAADGSISELTRTGGGGAASANAAPSTSDLVGMRARNIDSALGQRGFSNVGGYKTNDASITTWWHPGSETCLSVTTRDGRIAAIDPIFKGNCQ